MNTKLDLEALKQELVKASDEADKNLKLKEQLPSFQAALEIINLQKEQLNSSESERNIRQKIAAVIEKRKDDIINENS